MSVNEYWERFYRSLRRKRAAAVATFVLFMFFVGVAAVYVGLYLPPAARVLVSTAVSYAILLVLVAVTGYMAAQIRYFRILVIDRIFGGIEHVSWFTTSRPEEVSTKDLPDLFAPDFPERKVTIIRGGRFGKTLVFPFSSEHGVPPQYFFNEGRFFLKTYGRKATPEEFVAYLFALVYDPDNPDPRVMKQIAELASKINPYAIRPVFGLPEKYVLILPYALTPFIAEAIHESTLAEAPGKLDLVRRVSAFYGGIIRRLFKYIDELGELEKGRIEDLAMAAYRTIESAAKSATVPVRLLAELIGVEPDKIQEAGVYEFVKQGTARAVVQAGAMAKDMVEEGAKAMGMSLVSSEEAVQMRKYLSMMERMLEELAPLPVKKEEKAGEERGE